MRGAIDANGLGYVIAGLWPLNANSFHSQRAHLLSNRKLERTICRKSPGGCALSLGAVVDQFPVPTTAPLTKLKLTLAEQSG